MTNEQDAMLSESSADERLLTELSDVALHQFLLQLCERSGVVASKYFRQSLAVDRKPDTSPVTAADREIETLLRQLIASRFPEHAILGEEFGGSVQTTQPLWVLDPIDGTKNFITGKPLFGTLIGLCIAGLPRAGVIDMPALNERWIAVGNGRTYGIDGFCATRQQTVLADASLYATSPDMFNASELSRFDALSGAVAFRSFGADCYGYALLAQGFVDLVVEASLKIHDFCALAPVIKGAGGVITDWQGEPLTVRSNGQVLAAANPRLHAAALAHLKPTAD